MTGLPALFRDAWTPSGHAARLIRVTNPGRISMAVNGRLYLMVVGLSAVLMTACAQDESTSEQSGADLILTGARIFTADTQQPWAEALAIRNGEFIYVGNAADAAPYLSDDTRSIDLEGRLVIPGLVDAHAHPGYIDVEQYGEISATTEEDLLAAVKAYADTHADEQWLRLCCWPSDLYVSGNRGPTRQILDSVVPDRPVWFVSEWWHSYWLNSKALDLLGVDKDTPDPKPGVAMYMRDENGEPTGWVKEGAGWQHVAEYFPIATEAHRKKHRESVLGSLQWMSQLGITTLYDAGNFGYEDLVYGYLSGLEKDGRLPVRYEGTYQVFLPERRKAAVAEMKRYRSEYGGQRLRFNTIKLFMDGILPNRSSALLQPYVDDPDRASDTLLSTEELRDFLIELHEEQFDLHVHTIGDLAVRRTLDAVEAAKGVVGDDFYPRVTISHLGLVDSADMSRIRQLGVIADFTPWWFTDDPNDPVKTSIGQRRYGSMYRARSLFDLGVVVTLSSDEWWGGEKLPTFLNPFFGMQVGHTRQPPKEWRDGKDASVRPPENERLSIEQLVTGYTRNAAYQMRMENEIGSIEAGKLADLVILDDNLFEMDPYAIWKTVPAAVLMEGEIIQGTLPD